MYLPSCHDLHSSECIVGAGHFTINWPKICCVGCVVYISVTPKSKSYNPHLVWPIWRHYWRRHGNLRHKMWRERCKWPSCTTTKELAWISTKHCTQSTFALFIKVYLNLFATLHSTRQTPNSSSTLKIKIEDLSDKCKYLYEKEIYKWGVIYKWIKKHKQLQKELV